MAHQIPGTATATYQQTAPFPSLSRRQDNPYQQEMVSGLFLSKNIVYQNGKPAYLVDLAKAFEWLFNIKIGDCYQKHEDVIKRKPGKLTGFLNGLVELIKKEHDKKGYR